MKFSLKFVFCLCYVFLSLHVNATSRISAQRPVHQGLISAPNPCEIELLNQSNEAVRVFVRYDDGGHDKTILSRDDAQYVDLYYPQGGYCQQGAFFEVKTMDYVWIYSGYVQVRSTVRILPFGLQRARVIPAGGKS
jgi:hypothetical protein